MVRERRVHEQRSKVEFRHRFRSAEPVTLLMLHLVEVSVCSRTNRSAELEKVLAEEQAPDMEQVQKVVSSNLQSFAATPTPFEEDP